MKEEPTIESLLEKEYMLQQAEIIQQLHQLNTNVEKQLSVKHLLLNGLIYGLSFAVGSTILFSIVAKLFFPGA